MGHHALISFFVVMVRRYYFSKRFEDVLVENQKRKEEYKLKKLQKQQENSKMLGPIRRRMSLISIRSTPVQNSARFSIFSKDRRGSFGTQATKNSEEKSKEYSSIQMDANSNQNEDEQAHSSRRTSGISPFDRDTADDDSTNKNGNSSHISSSNKSTNSSISLDKDKQNNASTTPNAQQITFREDTNILRERERKKFQQQVHQGENNSIPIYRTNSESEIMNRPIAKSQLTRHVRYRMGGTEYCALDMLAWLIPIYYLGFVIVFGFMFQIYVSCSTYAQAVLETSNPNGPVEPWFFSFFLSLSAFTNLGLNSLDASMVPFQNAPCPLILCIILILVGNTAFAIMLRFIIWVCYRLTPRSKELTKETFRYLLDHPRRCYTTLFPSTQTWWLLIVLVIITLIELVSFLALNYWLPVLSDISWGSRFLDGLFQSVATRNAGFSVISLADLNPGSQLVYIVAMYISVYPVAISMRNSNIYQERALGIFRGENEEPQEFSEVELSEAPFIKLKRHSTMTSIANQSKKLLRGPDFFVITQVQRQLTSDICWVITGIFLICVIEAQPIMSPSPITIATVIYECVSAFGNVGASTGYPNTSASQAAQYRTLSKLVLIALMYRGRHRGLPASIDRSILLPSDELAQKEKEDELRRRTTSVSTHCDASSSSHPHPNDSNIQTQLIYTRSCTL
ncbi:hypothetical protein G6F62_007499 [Rhizopus arrhizus]|nr:hypothetical protein G6F62_007499 [Rhizopus arrhizus]KAG1376710.1 hypothetical protein G6F61_007365 [Rhizopus arrhizus]